MEQLPLAGHVSSHVLPCTGKCVDELFVDKGSNLWLLLQISDSGKEIHNYIFCLFNEL